MRKGEEILSAIFDCCPNDWFDQRVNGRHPNDRIRGTIPRPNDALALLKRRFSDQELIAAGVAKPAFGELQIVSALCQTGGAVMALRKTPTEPPFDVITARGSLTGVKRSVISALEDSRRAALVDIESFTESAVDESGTVPNYLTARKDLIHQLGVGAAELAADSGRFADSLQDYDSAVRTELAEPLINWAQKNTNPTISVVGSQLAEVVTLLHRITPRLHALQMHRLEEFSGSDGVSLGSGLFSDYMRLLDRFSRLSSEIIRWMTP